MQIVTKRLDEIRPYAKNPRKNDNAVEPVANSIREFGFKVPIIIDKSGEIVAGHTRYKAAQKLGLTEVPCIVADDLTPKQIKAFRLADNRVSEAAVWDDDLLSMELDDLRFDFNMADFGFAEAIEGLGEGGVENFASGQLLEKFIVPPFSVLNARAGYWQKRKKAWKDRGLDSGAGRGEDLLRLDHLNKRDGNNLTGTSIFDPVLCEILYSWFNIPGGSVFDPFAGGSVRGIIAEHLGHSYIGIDLSEEQVEANRRNAEELGYSPTWICDDSLNADRHIEDESADMILSCPPYGDLERYSDDPRDLSTMSYEEFLRAYAEIIKVSARKLKQDRFAAWVVGDIRDKKGAYRNFVSDSIRLFQDAGLCLYNHFILVEATPSAAFRAGSMFNNNRKHVKCHQDVLVFYKGDIKKIRDNFHMVLRPEEMDELASKEEQAEEE